MLITVTITIIIVSFKCQFQVGQRVDLIFEELMFELWTILTSMPYLTKLQWAGHPLRHLGKFKMTW
jgi:hypothetical protein